MKSILGLYQVVKEAEGDKPDKDEFETLPDNDEGEESTDYTADTEREDETPDGEANTDAEEETPEEPGDDSTDYTVDSEETDGSEDATDATDETNTETEEETPPEESPSDTELSRQLLNDFINLHSMCGTTVSKLTQVDKSNIIVNQIVARITSNINQMEKHLYEFIVFKFGKGKYPYNLYKYNQFVEAFRINVEMLKKINVLASNSQNN